MQEHQEQVEPASQVCSQTLQKPGSCCFHTSASVSLTTWAHDPLIVGNEPPFCKGQEETPGTPLGMVQLRLPAQATPGYLPIPFFGIRIFSGNRPKTPGERAGS